MLLNYFKTAVRHINRQRGYSFINISGLAIGIAVFTLISLWVFDEISFDRFHAKKDRIFRANSITKEYGLVTSSSWRLGKELQSNYPEIETFSRYRPWGTSLVEYKDKVFNELNFRLADPDFFKIFSFEFIYGDAKNALAHKNSIVLTNITAKRYFGDENPLGKSLFVRKYNADFKVSGVIKNIPLNSTIQFDLLARVDLMPKQRLESWEFTGYTYILLKENANVERVNRKIADFYREYVSEESEASPVLQPFTEIHLYEQGKPGIIKQVYMFSVIAVFILLIACINFMNISTARSAQRTREIGMRKVVGARRNQLISQFLGESILVSIIAMIIALFLVELLLPYFNQFTAKQLTLFSSDIVSKMLFLIGVILFCGLVSGIYPALYLSSFRPKHILKGDYGFLGNRQSFRSSLSIIQFTIAIGLIVCTIVIHNQLHFIQNKDLGMNRELVIGLPNNQDLNKSFESFKGELLKDADIISVTASATNPFDVGQYISINWEGHYEQDELPLPYTMVDYDYFETFEMHIVEGRGFSEMYPSDENNACLVNQSAVKAMGIDSPVGTEVYFNHPAFEESFKKVKIIGVVEDFHHSPLNKAIKPFIFRMYKPWHSFVFIKIAPGKMKESLAFIETTSKAFSPDYPFHFMFLDQVYNNIYKTENMLGKLFNILAVLAILISCLGLYGLAAYTTEQRTKEIGIRKVLGASVINLIGMLTKEFSRWVIIANVIAWPVAWYFMNRWLNNFVYHTQIGWWVFILAGGTALLIALLTISWQAIRTALANPAKSLRYE